MEPVDDITAQLLKVAIHRSLGRWEPRIEVNYAATIVTPLDTNDGYFCRVVYTILETDQRVTYNLTLPWRN